MRSFLVLISLCCGLLFPSLGLAQTTTTAQPYQQSYYLGTVIAISEQGTQYDEYTKIDFPYQALQVRLDETSAIVSVRYGGQVVIQPDQLMAVGDRVVLTQSTSEDLVRYDVIDKYRLPAVGAILLSFCFIVILISRWKGIGALLSLGLSLVLLTQWIIPQILSGHNAVIVMAVGIAIIAVLSFYLGHGFSIRTTIALMSTLFVLLCTAGLSVLVTTITNLSGTGTEEAVTLKYGYLANVDLKQLLLAGIMVAVLGVLDDITTAQAAIVEELHIANPKLTWTQLFLQGFRVGREHIISLVNTLVLVYAGTSLSLVIALAIDHSRPLWVVFNSEQFSETIMQTIIGNLALVLAVPLTTVIAALWWTHVKPHTNVSD